MSNQDLLPTGRRKCGKLMADILLGCIAVIGFFLIFGTYLYLLSLFASEPTDGVLTVVVVMMAVFFSTLSTLRIERWICSFRGKYRQ